MLKGETWLLNADLFKEHWVVEAKPWARNLGWFTKLQQTAEFTKGWFVSGSTKLKDEDVVKIVDQEDAKQKLYCWNQDQWWTFEGPVLLVAYGRVAGWAGPKILLDDLKLTGGDDPWDWPGIQIIDVDPAVTLSLDIEKGTGIYHLYDTSFDVAKSLSAGWMLFNSGNPDFVVDKAQITELLDSDEQSIVHKLSENVWLLNSKHFSLANLMLPPGYDLADLRQQLSKCEAKFAWVSDKRPWPGWIPKDQYQLECIHVWPDVNQKFGSELFLPVQRFLELTVGAEDLNAYPDIVFYDKPL